MLTRRTTGADALYVTVAPRRPRPDDVIRQVPAGAGAPEMAGQCANGLDDDADGFIDDGCLLYPLHDHLGSTVGVTDQAGQLVASQKYWPYGATRSGSVSGQTDKQYTGQQVEPGDVALGLYNYKARFYSTVLGRFVSADPTQPTGSWVALNRFAYANNNLLRFVDPTGFDPTQQDLDNCAENVVQCLWWSAAGDARQYIELVADWFRVPSEVLAAIVLNESQSRTTWPSWSHRLPDSVTEPVGTACVRLHLHFCADASYGIAQIKLSTARNIETSSPEFEDLAHDDDFIVARLKHPLWAIAYAAALLRGYKQELFTTEPEPHLPHAITDADYIVAYRFGELGWINWMHHGGCDSCGDSSPGQIRKVRALETDAVRALGTEVQEMMRSRAANE